MLERRRDASVEPEAPRYYRPELDVLRFFAFCGVFLSHVVPGEPAFYEQAHIPRWLAGSLVALAAGGAFGVDLFFALSSFLITTLLLRERAASGGIDVRSFYIRRVLRIWPLYFVFLLVVTPVVHVLNPSDTMPLPYTLAFLLLCGNWAIAFWGYPHSMATPLWSVSIEEQFYLAWPLVMRRWLNHLGVIACGLLALSFVTRLFLVAHGAVHPAIWCNTLARLDPIACGALLALHARKREIEMSWIARAALLASGCAVLGAAAQFGDYAGSSALLTYPVVTAACVALILGTLDAPIPGGWSGWVVRRAIYLGRISYGLYVFHSMFVLILHVQTTHGVVDRPVRMLAALIATIATAGVSYRLLERPFLRLKDRYARVHSQAT